MVGCVSESEESSVLDKELEEESSEQQDNADSTEDIEGSPEHNDSGVQGGETSGEPSEEVEEDEEGVRPLCSESKVVHFVYFVEADSVFSQDTFQSIEDQALVFQNYWYEQLGTTFLLGDPIVDVVYAQHDAQWYLETDDGIHGDPRWYRLGNIMTEVYANFDYEWFDSKHRVVNYPTSRHDGRVGANFGGAWMDGDDLECIANGGVNWPYDDGNSAHCLGHVAHEFGHVLGLDHTGPQIDCMQFGFYNGTGGAGMCSFYSENVERILQDTDNAGWFGAQPGDSCRAQQ